jgi:very-short-patch-repair endonuclease
MKNCSDHCDSFIERSKKIHNNYYSYDKVDYKTARENVIIECPKHGEFLQLPYNHLIGKGCNKCSIDRNIRQFTKSVDDFISQSKEVHGDKYSYDGVLYRNDSSKVEILCPEHGIFSQTPNKHLRGQGCPGCRINNIRIGNIKKYSQLFPSKANKVHNNKYIYTNTNYINTDTKIEIVCPIHGAFLQKANNHLSGKGCQKCNQSHGERKIETFLIDNSILYERQKKFDDCKNITMLSFDFWIESKNLLIEFDGIQHFLPVEVMGGEKSLEYTKKCDSIKSKYCIDNNINLLRINYKEIRNIENILSNYLS